MAFAIQLKLTSEITDGERARFCSLFTEVFGREFPEDLFLRKYRDAYTGNSLHCLAGQDEIVGAFSAVLYRYSFFGCECVFASAIDLMLQSKFRPNAGLVRRMSEALYSRLAEQGVAFVFSCVREEIMRFHEALAGWRNIGRLSYYAVPIRGPHVPGAGALLRTMVQAMNVTAANVLAGESPVRKLNDDLFRKYRYSVFRTEYRQVEVGGGGAVYTRKMFWKLPGAPEAVRVAFLVDAWPQEHAVFDAVVREIVKTEPEIDYLIYPGRLPFQPKRMWHVPAQLARPRYYLGGRILRPDLIDERVYQFENWDINLSNTDLV